MAANFNALSVLRIVDETPEAYTLCLANPDLEKYAFHAGQYLTINVEIDGEMHRRAFSLSNSPDKKDELHITIKRVLGGKVSNYLKDNIKEGDEIDVMPPMGSFMLTPEVDRQRHYIFVGAGSGISPLMSMLQVVLEREPLSIVSLWYGNRDEASIIFFQRLEELKQAYKGRLSVYHTLSQPSAEWKGGRGRLDQKKIYEKVMDLFMIDTYRKQYFICGPEKMMDGVKEAFSKHAINPQDVHQEYYNAPLVDKLEEQSVDINDLAKDQNNPDILTREVVVELSGSLHSLMVEPEQSILDAAEAAELDPPYTCKVGICTTCKAKLVRGKVHMDESMGLSPEEIEEGYVLTCQAHPLEENVKVIYE